MFSLFSRKPLLREILPSNYIDIHNHVLPGIDDGASTVEDSELLISGMKELGIKKSIATPHTFFWKVGKYCRNY